MLTVNENTRTPPSSVSLKRQSIAAQEPFLKASPGFLPVRLNRASAPLAALKNSPVGQSVTKAVPRRRQPIAYRISVSGTTYAGNTSFPAQNTSYAPAANFRLPGALVIERRLGAQNSARRNGLNAREITLVIGNDASLTTAGTLRYSTHTWGHRHWVGRTVGRPPLDTAVVRANNRRNILTASVDQQWARNDTTNQFVWRSGVVNAPKQILAGRMAIKFTNRGRRVSGSVTFFGNGFIEPGAYAYTATFTGSLFR